MNLSLSAPAHCTWHQSPQMKHCTRISHIIREPSFVVCTSTNGILYLITIFSSRIGLDSCLSRIPFQFLRSLFVSCLPGWNNFLFFKDSSNFLLHGEHFSIWAELLGRPRPELVFLKIGMDDISSGNMKSVDVFSVDCWGKWVEYEIVLRAKLPATSEVKKTKWGCSVLHIPLVTAVLLHRDVLFCCCIEINVFKNIPIQGVQAASPKASCRNFSCLPFQVCITKEFRYLVSHNLMFFWPCIIV